MWKARINKNIKYFFHLEKKRLGILSALSKLTLKINDHEF